MKVPLLTLDTPNHNNRIYPRAVWEKAVAEYKAKYIDNQRAVVTSKPPEGETISINDVVGVVKEIKTEGNTVTAEVIFLNIPDEFAMQQALNDGVLSIRTAGIGEIKKQEDGTYLVGEDYKIISCFLTNEP
jgi:hypothetical protein